MDNLGKSLIIIGAIIFLVAFNMDVSVENGYGRVNNIGLIADRSKYLLLGALFVVAGLFVNFKSAANQSVENVSDSGEIKCPFCAELIKKDAKLCKHCKSPIPESQSSPSLPATTTPAHKSSPEPPTAKSKSTPQASPKIDRSEFNKSFTAEFSTPLNKDEIRALLSNKLSGEIKGFQKDSLLYIQGKSVYAEATLSNIKDSKWSVKVDYSEEMSTWSQIGIQLTGLVISAIIDSYKLFAFFLIVGPIAIILRAIFTSRISTSKIKTAIDLFMQSVQVAPAPSAEKPRLNFELTSSDTYALKLVSIGNGNHTEEVKAALREILELGVNDTNDLICNQPCIIVSGLSASEVPTIKYKLMKAGASVEAENC